MAYVSISWGAKTHPLVTYVLKDRNIDDVLYTHDCSVDNVIRDFESVRNEHHKYAGNQVLHVLQAFSPEDSLFSSPEEINFIGKSLIEDIFPGHQFIIRTHTDTNSFHNHIVINTVNSETGKKIENKKWLIEDLRDKSDSLCYGRNLSVIKTANESRPKLSPVAQKIVQSGRQSYILDLTKKIDAAKGFSTNFDEFKNALQGFNINVRITEKNITYYCAENERGKRGSKLGPDYNIKGLEKKFNENNLKFKDNPHQKQSYIRESEQIKSKGVPKPPEGMSRFARSWDSETARKASINSHKMKLAQNGMGASGKQLRKLGVPANEISKANRFSIYEYCNDNKVKLAWNDKGSIVLKDKPYINIDRNKNSFLNTKNGKEGGIIDFVSAHKSMTPLQSVAYINNNPNLLHLNSQQSYESFRIKESDTSNDSKSLDISRKLFAENGISPNLAGPLLKGKQLQVDGSGKIWLYPKDTFSSGICYNSDFSVFQHHGKKTPNIFFEKIGKGKTALFFLDPVSLLKCADKNLFSTQKSNTSTIGLFTLDKSCVFQALFKNDHIKDIVFIKTDTSLSLDKFMEDVRSEARSLGVTVTITSFDQRMKQLSRDQDYSIER